MERAKLLRIIELMEEYQNSDFEGLCVPKEYDRLLDREYERSMEIIGLANELLEADKQGASDVVRVVGGSAANDSAVERELPEESKQFLKKIYD